MLLEISIVLAVLAFILALHHWYIHCNNPPPDGIVNLCLLQPKDFCACHCTHENWILVLLIVSGILLVLSCLG